MITMDARLLDLAQCRKDLKALEDLLTAQEEIAETLLLNFFTERPDLLLLMGDTFFPSMNPAAYQRELSVLGEFRADFAVANALHDKILLVEFESAMSNSVFVKKGKSSRSVTYQWSARFEHGFSQVVDWYYRIDDLQRSHRYHEHFGADQVAFEGILVIGRDKFVSAAGCEERLEWRKTKTNIDSRHLYVLTFDRLFQELQGRLECIVAIQAGDLT